MKVFLEFDFNKFEREVLSKPKTLGGLDTLDSNVIDFKKYHKPRLETCRLRYSKNIFHFNGEKTYGAE